MWYVLQNALKVIIQTFDWSYFYMNEFCCREGLNKPRISMKENIKYVWKMIMVQGFNEAF